MGTEAEGYEELLSGYDDINYCYNITFLTNGSELPKLSDDATEEEIDAYMQKVASTELKNNGFVIYRTIDDPNNGVTILYVEDIDHGILCN